MVQALRLVGLWGIAGGLFRVLAPRRRSFRWSGRIGKSGKGSALLRVFAVAGLAGSAYVLLRRGSRSSRLEQPIQTGTASAPARLDRAMVTFERSRILRAVFRTPRLLYHLGLGWLLGHRFLMLTHRGRKSGQIHQTVLEVVRFDPRTCESVVVSGWGKRADWYRNIQTNPALEVQTGRDRFTPTYRELTPEENYEVVVEYVNRLPALLRPTLQRLGFDSDGTEEERREHAAQLLMIAFRPHSDGGEFSSEEETT